ncbi:hypothetical protein ACTAJO_003998 [Vibrio fluvialis]
MNLKLLGIKIGLIDNYTKLASRGWEAIYLDNELIHFEPIEKGKNPQSLFASGYYLVPPKNCLIVVNMETEYEAVFLCGNHLRTYPISLSPFVMSEIDIDKFKNLSENPDYFGKKIYVDGRFVTTLLYE